ncbi:nitroreductase family protein [Candidatus Uabimicrobium sp. HlEnr_7]|uniref:nitroreductase family protein n=1 Tax=Candidatus Uabimicrobium helgolandensis TaxID=3095367 RepID=UPI003558B844
MNQIENVFHCLENRSSVRSYDNTKKISIEEEHQIVKAAQRSSTSFNLQTYSFISIKDPEKRKRIAELCSRQSFICDASLFFAVCVDLNKMEIATQEQGYQYYQAKFLESFLMACVDATLAGQTASIAAESLGYGICMIGGIRNHVDKISEILELPPKVFAIFGLCVGVPRKKNPPKARLPLSGVLFENRYDGEAVKKAMHEYNDVMAKSGIYENRHFPKEHTIKEKQASSKEYGWLEHCARRVATQNPEKSRTELSRILLERGFCFE